MTAILRPKYRRNISRAFRGLPDMDSLSLGCIFSMCGEGGDSFCFDGSGNGNHGKVYGNPVHKYYSEIGEWGYDFDGTGDFIAIPNFSDGWITPSGGGQSENWTNTGLAHDTTDGCLWLGDFTNSRAVKVTIDGKYITSFSLTGQPQGVAYDSSDDTLWVSIGTTIYHLDKTGSEIDTEDRQLLGSGSGGANGLSYDAVNDTLWVARGDGDVNEYDASTGSSTVLATPLTNLTPAVAMDGCHYEPSDGTLWCSSDVDNKLYNISSSDGSTITSFSAGDYVEDLVIIGTKIYLNMDATQHGSQVNANRCFMLSLSGVMQNPYFKKEFAITMWLRPGASMTNNGIAAIRSGLGNYRFSLNVASGNNPRFIVKATSTYTSNPSYPISSTSTWYPLGVNYNGSTIKVYGDGVQKGSVSASGNLGPSLSQAEFWIGNYFAASYFNGDIAGLRVYNRPLSASEFALAAVPNRRPVERRRVFYIGTAASSVSATVAATIGGATCSGSATFTAPTYSATASSTVGGATASASASHTTPTYTASATPTTGGATVAASASFATVIRSATAAATIGGASASASATFTAPVYTATAAPTVGGTTVTVSATHTPPSYTATASPTIGGATATATASFATSISTATAAVTTAGVSVSIAATFTAATFVAFVDTRAGVRVFDTRANARIFDTRANVR